MAFVFPFIADKKTWPHAHAVEYFDEWPVRQPSLLFAGISLSKPQYLAVWSKLIQIRLSKKSFATTPYGSRCFG